MKWLPLFFFIISLSLPGYGQNIAYDVMQTHITSNLKDYTALDANPIFTGFVVKENGVECMMPDGKYSFIKNENINKKYKDGDDYELVLLIDDNLQVTLFFTPYPKAYSEPKLILGMVTMGGLIENDPNKITFFRLVFHEEAMMD